MQVRLTIDKTGMLQECPLYFEIYQDYAAVPKDEQITLGKIKLNLAEYCDADDGSGEDGLNRRYLMQESKINSTLKVRLSQLQIDSSHTITGWDLHEVQGG